MKETVSNVWSVFQETARQIHRCFWFTNGKIFWPLITCWVRLFTDLSQCRIRSVHCIPMAGCQMLRSWIVLFRNIGCVGISQGLASQWVPLDFQKNIFQNGHTRHFIWVSSGDSLLSSNSHICTAVVNVMLYANNHLLLYWFVLWRSSVSHGWFWIKPPNGHLITLLNMHRYYNVLILQTMAMFFSIHHTLLIKVRLWCFRH